ncbi:MAG: PEP-CTERM sorting domain-containing protein [Rhodospirillaceae bacterium]|nr:PEP-CTERM sorting domain-containing protein [Rhodospirillales bacterium]
MKLSHFLGALVIGLTASAVANASAIITNVTADNPSAISGVTIDEDGNVSLTKTFSNTTPITLIFTVSHTTGGGNKFSFNENIINNSGVAWTDFHFQIIEPAEVSGNGVVFTSFQQSELTDFDLLGPSQTIPGFPKSGPRSLNFIADPALPNGGSTDASFDISPFDPGNGCNGNVRTPAPTPCSYTFQLVQTPTFGNNPPVDVPEPASMTILGAGLLGLSRLARRRRA